MLNMCDQRCIDTDMSWISGIDHKFHTSNPFILDVRRNRPNIDDANRPVGRPLFSATKNILNWSGIDQHWPITGLVLDVIITDIYYSTSYVYKHNQILSYSFLFFFFFFFFIIKHLFIVFLKFIFLLPYISN